MGNDIISAVLSAAASAAQDPDRGRLLWRRNGRECRMTAPDTLVITGGPGVLVHRVVDVDLEAALK